MSKSDSPAAPGSWAPTLARLVDQVCDRFEAAWKVAGPGAPQPRVEDYVGDAPAPGRSVLVSELVPLEVYYRRRAGDEPQAAEYQARFPAVDPEQLALALAPGPVSDPYATRQPRDSAEPPRASALAGPWPLVEGYEIVGELGRGGMGVVYKARQQGLNRLVALKMILAGAHAGPEDLARFRYEAQAVAELQHANIVQIYEVGEQDGLPFFSLEYVDGGSLDKHLRGSPLPTREAAELTETLTRAVHVAHQRGIIHRDLKPGNILLALSRDGPAEREPSRSAGPSRLNEAVPKITDFGLAKKLDAAVGQTQSGVVVGTPSYMAPEQASGKSKSVGLAADVYALGAILYELLTGRPPFKAATPMETVMQVLSDEPVTLRRLQPKVPRDLETIALKCLQKAPGQRYASAGDLADDLRRYLNGEPIQARPVSTWERVWTWVRRRPAVAALIVASTVAVLATVGVITGSLFYARLQKEVERAELFQYGHHIAVAHAEWRDGSVSRVEPLLEACPPHRRRWEWYYLQRLCHQDLLTFRGHAHTVRCVAFSPEGKRLASASYDGTVMVRDAGSGQVIHIFRGHTAQIWSMTFNPDGTQIASGSWDGCIKVWDTGIGKEVNSWDRSHDGAVFGLAFSPDGERLASGGEDRRVKVWDVGAGKELFRLEGHTKLVMSVAYSPDGKQIASASHDRTVKVWDACVQRPALLTLEGHLSRLVTVAYNSKGTRLASSSWDGTVKVWDARLQRPALLTLKRHAGAVMSAAFSPDDSRLASGASDGAVKVWDAEKGQEALLTLKGHTSGVMSVAFSPDGQRLASASSDTTVKLWDPSTDKDTQEARTASIAHAGPAFCVAISRDGKQLAAGSEDGTVTVLDATTLQPVLQWRAHRDEVRGVAFSPDGQRLASSSFDKTVKVWDLTTGERILLLPHTHEVRGLAFSPDGKQLASGCDDRHVRLWDATTGDLIQDFVGHTEEVRGVTFSPEGNRLASASFDETVRIWDLTDDKKHLILQDPGRKVWAVVFSQDGRRLASASRDTSVKIWDAKTGHSLHTFNGHNSQVSGVAFSPDGTRLASASQDCTVRLWDTATGEQALMLKGHTSWVWGVIFSPDGNKLISVSDDRTLKVWDGTPLPE